MTLHRQRRGQDEPTKPNTTNNAETQLPMPTDPLSNPGVPPEAGCDSKRAERLDARIRDAGALPSHPPASRAPQSHPPNTLWRESLALMEQHGAFGRHKVQAGVEVYMCGKAFESLYLVNSGLFKIVNLAPNGHEQPAGWYLKGDWLGFDGIPTGRHGCSAIARDIGELWSVRYDDLLQAGTKDPRLMRMVLAALSAQLARNRDAALVMGTLSADARVADFLLQWARALSDRGMRTDQIDVHMSRSDIGKYLGLRLESVSRALSKLARCGVIHFSDKGRRDIGIPDLEALRDFIQNEAEPSTGVMH